MNNFKLGQEIEIEIDGEKYTCTIIKITNELVNNKVTTKLGLIGKSKEWEIRFNLEII